MHAGYTHISVRTVRSCRDGALVITTGRFRRFLTHTELADRDHILELIGEPFDFSPGHDTAIEVWGQLWLSPRPRLLLHDARPLGGGSAAPPTTRTPLPGEAVELLARVTALGGVHLATTPHHHTFVLCGDLPPTGIHTLTGHVLSLTPPLLKVSAHHAASPSSPPPEAPHA